MKLGVQESALTELTEALLRVRSNHSGVEGKTYNVTELCEILGRGEVWVRRTLRVVIKAGLWEVVRVRRQTITGFYQLIPAYRPKVSVPKKKKR